MDKRTDGHWSVANRSQWGLSMSAPTRWHQKRFITPERGSKRTPIRGGMYWEGDCGRSRQGPPWGTGACAFHWCATGRGHPKCRPKASIGGRTRWKHASDEILIWLLVSFVRIEGPTRLLDSTPVGTLHTERRTKLEAQGQQGDIPRPKLENYCR